MSSSEEVAYPILRKHDVDYVLVIFGGLIGYSGDDINKFLWMVRIAQGVWPEEIQEPNYFTSKGEYRIDDAAPATMKNSLMYKMSYYRCVGPLWRVFRHAARDVCCTCIDGPERPNMGFCILTASRNCLGGTKPSTACAISRSRRLGRRSIIWVSSFAMTQRPWPGSLISVPSPSPRLLPSAHADEAFTSENWIVSRSPPSRGDQFRCLPLVSVCRCASTRSRRRIRWAATSRRRTRSPTARRGRSPSRCRGGELSRRFCACVYLRVS